MKNRVKGVVLVFFLLTAISSTVFTLAESDRVENSVQDSQAPGENNRYVLRDYEGYVAVFVENEPELPVTVTDIQVSTLRQLDRNMLATGMKVDTHEGLMMLLEDLGS